MRVVLVVVGVLAALFAGAVVLVTVGEIAAIVAFIVLLALTIYGGWFAARAVRGPLLAVVVVVTVASLGFGGWTAYQLTAGLLDEEGPVDPADPAALAAANQKFDQTRDLAAFRLEFTEQELTAVVQDGLTEVDSPVRRVALDFVGGSGDKSGAIKFKADFKNGSLSADGTVGYKLESGDIKPDVRDISMGAWKVPGAARNALEGLIERVSDLDDTLEEQRVTVQSLEITNDKLVMIGTQGGGKLLTSDTVLTGLRTRAAGLGTAGAAPAERVGPGVVDAKEAPGTPLYVALGDSLAAGVGVAQGRQNYVSRLHNGLQKRDGKPYGLRNFGVGGETSGTIFRRQLPDALDFMRGKDVAYVSLDIGANDLLAHLGSPDCSESADTPACKARIDATLVTYRGNLDTILRRLKAAAPNAKLLFLQTYNPFSFGFQGLKFEDDTNRIITDLNNIAAEVARRHGALVADGFTPLKGRATTTTHMTENPPDIHPLAIGYDVLAAALLDAK